jgi:hypothetical protein
LEKETELRKYRKLIAMAGAGALVVTFCSLILLLSLMPLMVAYFGSALIGLPFLVLLWRLESRYSDILFRDDM